jgi:hypothetical protein
MSGRESDFDYYTNLLHLYGWKRLDGTRPWTLKPKTFCVEGTYYTNGGAADIVYVFSGGFDGTVHEVVFRNEKLVSGSTKKYQRFDPMTIQGI